MNNRTAQPVAKRRKKPATPSPRKRVAKPRSSKTANAPMSAWMRYAVYVAIVTVLSGLFYFFVVKPYSYRWKPCYGFKGYGVCLPCSYSVHGIDISHYQETVDWNQLQTAQYDDEFPLRFVFIKATEGGDLCDDRFDDNFKQAREHGFVRGAYHYFIPSTDAARQARFFMDHVKLQAGDFPPVLDVEVKGKAGNEQLKQGVKTWLSMVEAHYGVKPILYTSYKFKERYLGDSVFNTYPYWIAHYYVDSVRYQGHWDFWQHTDVGTVPGISRNVDLNVYNGSLEQLQSILIKNDTLQ